MLAKTQEQKRIDALANRGGGEGGVGAYTDSSKSAEVFNVINGNNTVTSCGGGTQVAGRENNVGYCVTTSVTGNHNEVMQSSDGFIAGYGNKVYNAQYACVIGYSNLLAGNYNNTIFGMNNKLESAAGSNHCSFIMGSGLYVTDTYNCLVTGGSSGEMETAYNCHGKRRVTFGSAGQPIETLDQYGNLNIAGSLGSIGADYAELFEWEDGNPENEDRNCRFVRLNGAKIELATRADDDVIGVVSLNPSFVGDIGNMRADNSRKAAVGLLGKLIVEDDGSCTPNWYATVGANGTAKKAMCRTQFRVMERVDDTHVRILVR